MELVWTCWIKVKVVNLYSASTRSVSRALRYSTHCQGITVLPAYPVFHPQAEWAIPAFAFSAAAGTHLLTPEGWKAEQILVRSSPGRDSSLQPPDCKSGTEPNTLVHLCLCVECKDETICVKSCVIWWWKLLEQVQRGCPQKIGGFGSSRIWKV